MISMEILILKSIIYATGVECLGQSDLEQRLHRAGQRLRYAVPANWLLHSVFCDRGIVVVDVSLREIPNAFLVILLWSAVWSLFVCPSMSHAAGERLELENDVLQSALPRKKMRRLLIRKVGCCR